MHAHMQNACWGMAYKAGPQKDAESSNIKLRKGGTLGWKELKLSW